jgi:signal transduction histidine kinase
LSNLVLGAAVYYAVEQSVSSQLEGRIEREMALLRTDFRFNGLQWLINEVQQRAFSPGSFDYRLESRSGQLLAGNLPATTLRSEDQSEGWAKFADLAFLQRGDDALVSERILVTKLDPNITLVVGNDLNGVRESKRAVVMAFGWGLAITVFLGAVGGLVLSSVFLKRIDAMTQTAQEIIGGNLSQRIPQTMENDELDGLARTLNHMLNRIESLIEANRHMSSDLAHDLRSPLGRVLRRLEAAKTRVANSADYQSAIDASVDDINGLIRTFNALLRISQIESGARKAGFKNLDLADIGMGVAEAFQPAAVDEDKVLTTRFEHRLPCFGDKELLTQLVANLVDNAIRHTPSGARIEVSTSRDEDSGQLIIADDGPGVPIVHQKRIFERFYRVDTARKTPGDGLGLSLVFAIAELHDGLVWAVDNQPGLKVVFELASHTESSNAP